MMEHNESERELEGRSPSRETTWVREGEVVETSETTMVGVLEMVDLAAGSFGLTDAVGNKIALRQVQKPDEVGVLIGHQVADAGRRISANGRFHGLHAPVLTPYRLPPEWTVGASSDLRTLMSARLGPDPNGGGDLTDDEFAALMTAIKG